MRCFDVVFGNEVRTINTKILRTTWYYYRQHQGPALWKDSGSSLSDENH